MAYVRSDYFSDKFIDCFYLYLDDLSSNGAAESYWSVVRILCDYVKKDFLDINEFDADAFYKYMVARAQEGSLKNTTVNMRLSCYKNLANFITTNFPAWGYVNPFIKLRPLDYTAGIKPSKIPTLKEIDAILDAAKESDMFFLIITLAFRVALSVADITSMRLHNVKQNDNGLYLHFAKKSAGDAEKVVPLPMDVATLLSSYINSMIYVDADGHLFYNKYNNPLTMRNVDSAINKYVKKSGINNKYTLKDLRSRAILDMVGASLDNNIPVEAVAAYAGIRDLRLNLYVRAVNLVESCPADLVNIQVKTGENRNNA